MTIVFGLKIKDCGPAYTFLKLLPRDIASNKVRYRIYFLYDARRQLNQTTPIKNIQKHCASVQLCRNIVKILIDNKIRFFKNALRAIVR